MDLFIRVLKNELSNKLKQTRMFFPSVLKAQSFLNYWSALNKIQLSPLHMNPQVANFQRCERAFACPIT